MNPLRTKWVIIIVLFATIGPATVAQADFIKNVVRGLELFDYRFSGERNILGKGWTVNAQATYNNRVFDFGMARMTLNGVVAGSVGYTMRGIPKANFSLNSAGTPLSYAFEINNGIQNYSGVGNALINVNTSINALGFYSQEFHISNRGDFELTGLAQDTGTLDYDIGPINVSGNIFLDILAAFTQSFFDATGTQNPFAALSGRFGLVTSTTKTVEVLNARLKAGEILSNQELGALINNTIVASMLGSPNLSGSLFDGLMVPKDLFDNTQPAPETRNGFEANPIPEPLSISLLLLGLLGLASRRRL